MKDLIVFKSNTRVARLVGGVSAAVGLVVFSANVALAQTIGAQLGTMSQEASTASGFIASAAMYGGALLLFIYGAWALWQSRQPENREGGQVAKGIAGLVLCGLLVTGGAWINKAAQTATGGAATITSTAGVVTFQ